MLQGNVQGNEAGDEIQRNRKVWEADTRLEHPGAMVPDTASRAGIDAGQVSGTHLRSRSRGTLSTG